jgi:3-oxoadipate enol-lactonase
MLTTRAQLATATAAEQRVRSRDGVTLCARRTGAPDAPAIVVLHGLTGTRDSVLFGSTLLERGGFSVITYDARGHGASTAPVRPDRYGYPALTADLFAVLDAFEVDRCVLAGASLGCHTAIRLALEQPERLCGLAAITPAFDPSTYPDPTAIRRADRTASALRSAGVEGFLAEMRLPASAAPTFAGFFYAGLRRAMLRHRDLGAVADAIETVWRSQPFERLADLEAIQVPTIVVGSRELDVLHPLELAQAYAAALRADRFAVEPPGATPLAWRPGRLARLVLGLARDVYDVEPA